MTKLMARKDVIQIRCSEIEKERWKGVAASENLELSSWIRLTLDKTARLIEAKAAISHRPEPEPAEDDYDPWLANPPS